MTPIPLAYAFALLALLVIVGNLIGKIVNGKKALFAFNIAILLLLCANLLALDGMSSTYLNLVSLNPFSLFMMLILTIGLLLSNLIAYNYTYDYPNFALLGAFALSGAYLVASAASLMVVFLGLECASMPAACIMLISKRQGLEAATKFLIMSSVAIALLSFAIVLVYGSSGSLAWAQQQRGTLTVFSCILFIASLGIVTSAFPFGMFVKDVYESGSAYANTIFTINKAVGFAALMQVMILLFISFGPSFEIIAILSLLTMLYGSIVSLAQENFRKMIAYASISQSGYVLLAIATQSAYGVGAGLLQILAEMITFMGILCITALLERENRSRVDDLIGLYKENRFLAVALSVLLLSVIGAPFTIGFVARFLVLVGAIKANFLWLAVIGALNSAILAFCLGKAITAIYTDKVGARSLPASPAILLAVGACLLLVIAFGIYPQPLMAMAASAANYLFGII